MSIKNIILAGATGGQGKLIAKQLIQDGFHVTALVRPGHGAKHADLFKEIGLKYVEANGRADIISKTKGADAIVSVVAGDGSVFMDFQLDLLAAAKENKVKRFIPSEFGGDFEVLGANVGFFGYKAAVRAEVEKSGVPYTLIQTGGFYEYFLNPMFGFDYVNGKVEILADGNTPIRRTAQKDVAIAVSAVLNHPNPPKQVFVASEMLSERQAVAVFEEVFGKKFTIVVKTKEEWLKESESATDFFPTKFMSWAHSSVVETAEHAPNLQIPGSQSIREYAVQLKTSLAKTSK